MANQRVEWIDVFRGFGIILMIMGHINFGGKFDYYIHAFHMPMFFFISGYFFSGKDIAISNYIKKKFKTLIVPYISFAILHSVLYLIIYKQFSLSLLYHVLFVNTDGMPIAGALWFLTALFFADVLYFVLNKYLKDNIILLNLIVVILVLVGTLIPLLTGVRLPYALDISFVSIGFYHIGRLLGNRMIHYCENITNLNIWLSLSIIILFSFLVFLNGYVNMRTAEYSIVPLFWINAVALIIGYMNFARIIDDKLSHIQFLDKCILEIKFIGRNSIVYLCLNQVTILFLQVSISKLCKIADIQVPYWVSAIFILFLTLVLLHVAYIIIDKTKLKMMLGK